MTKPIARDPIYRKRGFDAEIIELCVRWYITYRLSYRDLVEMMAERGIQVAQSTILRWVTRTSGRTLRESIRSPGCTRTHWLSCLRGHCNPRIR
jgi:transposase-like protein